MNAYYDKKLKRLAVSVLIKKVLLGLCILYSYISLFADIVNHFDNIDPFDIAAGYTVISGIIFAAIYICIDEAINEYKASKIKKLAEDYNRTMKYYRGN